MDSAVTSRRRTPARGLARLGASGDAWFKALDHAVLTMGPESHPVQVLGIHLSDGHIWIQLAATDDPHLNFVVRVDTTHTINEVKATLRALPGIPEPLAIIRVGRKS
jgi:hypothetical protein